MNNQCVDMGNNYSVLPFEQQTRIKNDSCSVENYLHQSTKPGNYVIRNFHACGCEATKPFSLSLSQPTVSFRDGNGWTSMKGCNIDKDSKFRNSKTTLTNRRVINQLFSRPYNSVPYMGRGVVNAGHELGILTGQDTFQTYQNNYVQDITEGSFMDYTQTPMIPHIAKNIQRTSHIIPEDAGDQFVRYGIPSRTAVRDQNYSQRCEQAYIKK